MAINARFSFLVASAVASLWAGQAAATLYLYEPFVDATANGGTTYTTGAAVTGANMPATASVQNNGALLGSTLPGGAGGAKWFAAGPTTTGFTANTVDATNLGITGLNPSSGGSMLFGNSLGPSARVNVSSTPITTGTLFYSFAFKVTDLGTLGTSGGFVVSFNNAVGAQATTPSSVSDCLMVRKDALDASKYNLGVRKGTGTPTWGAPQYAVNDVVFVVQSYEFLNGIGGTDDIASMWLNPDPLTFGNLSPPATTLTHTGVADIQSPGIESLVFFRRNSALISPATMIADEIRVGTTWADVTPTGVPEAGPIALWGVTGIIGITIVGARRLMKHYQLSRTIA